MPRPLLRRIAATVAACLIAVGASACGGSSPTKKDVIARGNAICANAVSAVRAVVPPAKGTSSGTAVAGYVRQLQPIVAKEVSQLRKLPRPDADKALLNRYIVSVTKAGNVYKQLAAAAQRNDMAGVARYLGALRDSPAPLLAQKYGMSQCAGAAGTAAP